MVCSNQEDEQLSFFRLEESIPRYPSYMLHTLEKGIYSTDRFIGAHEPVVTFLT